MDFLMDLAQFEFMQRAMLAGTLAGIACPLIGTFLVLRHLSLMGDGIGHIAFAGVGAGLLTHVHPVVAAGVAAVGGAIGIEFFREQRRHTGDLVLGIFFYSGISLAAILSGLAGQFNANLLGYLFGSIVTIQPAEIWWMAALTGGVVLIVATGYRGLLAVAFDEESAKTYGLPVRAVNLGIAAMTAITITLSMRVVGILLVAALMVVPVAAAMQLAGSFRGTLLLAVVVSVASVAVGLVASYGLDLPPGATIVLVSVGLFLLATVTSAWRRQIGAKSQGESLRALSGS